jgi:hypothetical protein
MERRPDAANILELGVWHSISNLVVDGMERTGEVWAFAISAPSAVDV